MRALTMLLLLALLAANVSCKGESDPEAVPLDTAAATEPRASATPEPSAAQANADGSASGLAAQPPAPTTKVVGASIDACCAALGARPRLAKDKGQDRSAQAAALCQSIAPMVKNGKTTRASALRQIRAFVPGTAPAVCQ